MNKKLLALMGLAFGQDLTEKDITECAPETVSGWDSLSFLNFVALLEESCDMSFRIDEIAKMSEGGAAIAQVVCAKQE